jgi:hypothetical protein
MSHELDMIQNVNHEHYVMSSNNRNIIIVIHRSLYCVEVLQYLPVALRGAKESPNPTGEATPWTWMRLMIERKRQKS